MDSDKGESISWRSPRRPVAVRFAVWVLAAQAVIVGAVGGLAAAGALLDPSALGQGIAAAVAVICIPPFMALLVACWGLEKNKKWGRTLALIVLAALTILPWVRYFDEPETILSDLRGLAHGGPILTYLIAAGVIGTANLTACILLLREVMRARKPPGA